MMKSILLFAFAGLAAATPSVLSAKQARKLLVPDVTADGVEVIEGSFIVKLAAQKGVASKAIEYNATQVYDALPGFPGFAANLNKDQLAALLASPDVIFVEPDMVATTSMAPEDECTDSQTDHSWGQARTTQEALSLGTYYHEANWGIEVDVYVIDTGVRCSHDEFSDATCACGPSFCGGSDGCSDGNGHGTHCAGTVGGKRYGVAKEANIIGVKVLSDSGSGAYSAVIGGVNYAAEQAQVTGRKSVGSMSLGGGVCNSLNEAVNAATEAGCLMVVAAGNCASDACRYSPASAEGAITVGATTDTDARASYSNYGSCVDIFAPGSSITSAWSTSDTAYNTISGTSMACPHVAGAVAALFSIYPDMDASEVKAELSKLAVKGVVTNPGTDSPNELLHLECLATGATRAPTPTPKCSFVESTSVEGTLLAEMADIADQDACCDVCESTNGCEAFSFAAELTSGNEHELATTGTCESHSNGRCSTAADVAECTAAANALAPGLPVYTESDPNGYPAGCYNFLGFNVYFNQATTTRGDCSNYDCLCMCEAIPATPSACRLFSAGWSNVDAEDHVTAGVYNL